MFLFGIALHEKETSFSFIIISVRSTFVSKFFLIFSTLLSSFSIKCECHFVLIINPEIIIFTGGVARAGEIITDGVKKYLPKYALGMTMENLIFTFGKLEEEAGIKGAAALVMNK